MRTALSAVIITYNAAAQLDTCLRSVAWCDEIVVVDSGSSDGTAEIAARHGARFIDQPWLGYGPQKQAAVDAARHDWVLCIDADEWLSEELAGAIRHELESPAHRAYDFPRCNRFMGRWLRHGEGYPDLSLRLFHRGYARWSDDPIHEKVVCEGRHGTLHGDLMHESAEDLEDYLAKQNRYTSLQAAQLHARGERGGIAGLVLNPAYRFVKFYLLRLGFLDGLPGLVHIGIGCFNTFSKYAKLAALERAQRRD